MSEARHGQIVTFYAYKGGTGRTMMLANVAWILASNGRRVLVIDWDLEAPGLHRFFQPFLEDRTGTSTPGLIDFLNETIGEVATTAKTDVVPGDRPIDILPYVQSVKWPFEKDGYLDLMTAGRYDSTYPFRVNTFPWQPFYENLGGAAFLERLRLDLRHEYDDILIDSRTGVSDVSGICTVKMPDRLVIGFTLNAQSLTGSIQVARSIFEQRTNEPIQIMPVPMRVERAEKDLLDRSLAQAQTAFDPLMPTMPVEQRRRYWREIAVFYTPFYAFNEVLAVFGDMHRQSDSLLASAERLTGYITDGEVTSAQPVSEELRRSVLSQYNPAT
jgi:MinD-like ATPase involved in chromosome partitioning or flagellar assembly